MEITPHIAQNDTNRRSAVDERTTRHTVSSQSEETQADRRGVRLDEEHRVVRKLRHRGLERVSWMFTLRRGLQLSSHPQPNP